MLHAVIMAGGSGTRFWPRSRRNRPKQIMTIAGQKSLLAATFERLKGMVPLERTWVVTTEDLVEAIRSESPTLPPGNFLAEPVGRDTAAAIALAAVAVSGSDSDAVMIVMPSDHTIEPVSRFQQAARSACEVAQKEEYLVTFAVRPTYPATGFGYIEKGDDYENGGELPIFHVLAFTEKPDLATAKRYLRQGKYFWNSGIFVWKARRILDEIQKYLPAHAALVEEIQKALREGALEAALAKVYPSLRKVSIDYGVIEPAARSGSVLMMPATFHWDDVGSWASLANYLSADPDGNVFEGRLVAIESRDNIVCAEEDHLVATLGVSGLVIVQTPDATLVTTRENAQAIKRLIARLEERQLDRYL